MPYSDGKLIRYSGSSWTASSSEDFFFKAYFDTPVTPTYVEVDADFASGTYRGAIVDDSGQMTTDAKFLVAMLVDDTVSMSWSDPSTLSYSLKDTLPTFISDIFDRTATVTLPGASSPYSVSYLDFWIYSSTEINRSSGYTNSATDISTFSTSLFQRGLTSTLLGTAPLVINGLNYQSVLDAFIKPNDDLNNATRVNELVLYLQEIGCLRLNDIIAYWESLPPVTRSAWGDVSGGNQTADTICFYNDVSEFVVSRWANSFTPMAMIIADGDNSSPDSVGQSVQAAQGAWNDTGAPVFTFGIGSSHKETYLRTMSSESFGRHFHIASGNDWDDAKTSLLHNGTNSLFAATWSKTFDYDDPTWISQIDAVYSPSTPSINGKTCIVQARWSFDRLNFTPWATIETAVPFIIKEEILVLEYKITLKDGWTGSAPDKPFITSLTHTVVSPSIQYLFTPSQPINGMMFETLLTATQFLPETARATWGICRGESTDFADFSPVHTTRKSALPNRQQGVLFTKEVVVDRLPTRTDSEGKQYYVYTDTTYATIKTWATTDVVKVYQQIGSGLEVVVPPTAYIYNNNLGLITFSTSQSGTTIRVTITTPPGLYATRGETTSTLDYKTYYLSNGRWPHDASIVVLINQEIFRGGYWSSPDDGTITFHKERELTDTVSVFVEHSGVYKVGVEIRNFDPTVDSFGNAIPLDIKNFTLFYSVLDNPQLIGEYENTTAPYATDVKLLPIHLDSVGSVINPTIYERLTVGYTFNSNEGASENGTQIKWWRYRSGQSTVGQTTQTYNGQTYILLTDYNNRVTEKKSDVGTGSVFGNADKIFVEVIPSDGYKIGSKVASQVVTLDNDEPPYILSLKKPVTTNTSSPVIAPPVTAPTVSASSSTTSNFAAGTYKVAYSFTNNSGETVISNLATIVITAGQSIVVSPIVLTTNATGVNYYVSLVPGSSIVYLSQSNSGGINTTLSEMSEAVFISSPSLSVDSITGLASASIKDELTARYTYRNPGNVDNTPDETLIEWYLQDNPNVVKFVGKTVPANSTKKNEVYIFKATPYNGVRYGVPVWSSTILMT